jgi:hypothetical protein
MMESERKSETESEGDVGQSCSIDVDGVTWIATLAGASTAGSGAFGLGLLDCVDFAQATEPARALREALVQRGRFANMFPEEIIDLFHKSNIITPRVVTRRSLEDSH